MFHNNPASSARVSNNENAAAIHRSSKSVVEKGTKKASFNDENVKTPHRSNKDAAIVGKGGQQTAQRRRRAFGRDISNRGQAGGDSGGKGDASLKQTLTKFGGNNGKASFPSSSTTNRASQVAFSRATFAEGAGANNARLEGGSGARGVDAKPKQRTQAEYDGVFGATTRWADDDVGDESRSPFDLVPEEELNMVSKLRDESSDLWKRENKEMDRLELERCEEHFMEQIRAVRLVDETDMQDYGGIEGLGICGDERSALDLLESKLPWEEEDGEYDPAEERRLSGSDPLSLWGDVSNY
ncbi:hypothetical protein ACHAW5_004225 [Stephanodiscus triporus]|uniref:Uncharacterized protein n=1 Tax=Stephanodiscus triporus TaxID=2934178 RepID=A0ABD3NS33_9STRA